MTLGGEDRLAPRSGSERHEPGRLPVETEREPERRVDDEVDPQHLRGSERLAGGDVEQARAEEREHERDEQHEHEADVLREVVVDLPALLDREDDRGEVVVREDHATGVLRDVGSAPHRDADVGGLDGGRVVDAVAGHRDDVALLLQRVGQQHLVLRCDPPDHADVVDPGQPFGFRQRREVGAENGLTGDPELLGDRGTGRDVVAGHHPDPDVRGLGPGDRSLGLGARRIDHPDQTRHLQTGHVGEQVTVRHRTSSGSRSRTAAAMTRCPAPSIRTMWDSARSASVGVPGDRRRLATGRSRPGP